MSYFCIWLIWSGAEEKNAKFFIYLTNWVFLIFNLYLLVAALSTSIKYIHYHWILRIHESSRHFLLPRESYCSPGEDPVGLLNRANNSLKWYQMIHWLLFSIGIGGAVVTMVLFWSLLYRGGNLSGVNVNHHLIHGVLAIVDTFICGLPVNLLHSIYLITVGVLYSTFAGIYSLASGENIYELLDYQNNAASAVVLQLLVTFLVIPLLYFMLYLVYMGRVLLLYFLKKKLATTEDDGTQEVELSDIN